MSFFSKSPHSYLGVDIGSSAIKMVEFQNEKGRPKLATYGYLEQNNDLLNSKLPEAKANIIAGLRRLKDEIHTSTNNAVTALPSYTVFTSIIHLPEMSKKELAAAVKWEAKKFVPMPIEEMILDWKILEDSHILNKFAPLPSVLANGTVAGAATMNNLGNSYGEQALAAETSGAAHIIHEKGRRFLKILLTAAPKDLVSRYLEIFKEAKLNLISLETESFALERALIGRDHTPIMLIDSGASSTTIGVVVDSIPLINRSIDTGGNAITKAIASSLNIGQQRAEQFKRDFGLSQQLGGEGQIPKRIEFMVAAMINEIKYVLKLYASQSNEVVEKIVLAGGSAWLPNLPQYLEQKLGVHVFIGDPWAKVMYPVELEAVLKNLGPRLAVAVGLAMREIF